MKREDFEGAPCSCPLCIMAEVTDKPTRRDPRSGKWLHGYALKGVYMAMDDFRRRVQAIDDRKAGA